MKLKKQVTVCGAAIFCVAVFSLYLMLDRVQHDPARHQSGGNFPRSQISVLQNRIEQLEQLLEENHEIISHIKESVLELTAHAEGQPVLLPYHTPNGSWMLAVASVLPFDNQDGGVWKQGFDITYEPHEWDTEPLQVFVVPHSHNDPGWIKTFEKYYADQTQHILNSMVLKLQEDPRRRFIWSEISFFSKWWDNISTQKRAAVRRAHLLLDQYRKKSKLFRSKVLLVPLGDDFRYDKPQEWDAQFLNYQRLFDFLNAHPSLHVQAQFGTLSDYFDALSKRTGIVPGMKPPGFPVLSGDFFSYADREDHYWTGYYTSRPFYKSLDRVLEAHLRGAEVLYSLALSHARHAGLDSRYPLSDYALLTEARRALGLFQHHDAITGTAKEAVVVDYGVRLLHSLVNLKRVIGNAAHYLVLGDKEAYRYDPAGPFLGTDDMRLNQDSLPEKTVIKLDTSPREEPPSPCPGFVVLFNPLEQERLSVISLLVSSPRVRVLSEEGQPLAVQLSAQWSSATDMVPDVYQVSIMTRLPALGLSVLQLYKSFDSHTTLTSSVRLHLHGRDLPVRPREVFPVHVVPATSDDFCLDNQHMQACFSGLTGLLQSVRWAGEEHKLSSEFLIYGTRSAKDKSGAYLFLPDGDAKPYAPKEPPVVRVTEGPFFSEVASYYQHVQQVVRLYNVPGVEGLSLDVSCLVDIRDHVNKEMALRLSTSIASEDTFFTDLNGFQIQPRRFLKKLPLQANFYPMPAMAYIQDKQSRLTLHTAQALGVSSLRSGQLEVILDRRLMQDDNRGLGQGLKDNKRTCNRFRLLLERRTTANKVQDSRPISFPSLLSHMTSMHLNAEVLAMPVTQEKPAPPALRSFQPFSGTVPCDFHILNLRTLQAEDDSLPSAEMALILHRKGFDCGLEAKHLGFNCTTSQGKFSLGSLFHGLELGFLQPTSLTLMYPLGAASPNSTVIHMDPMEIATFRIHFG
ncbi:Alpha-mannosidase 2x [Chelonia mydas]|uniref:Alpha-mannosidase n=1 Tax=Chelonia mydas TaxID=8469 RepID=M7C686_CHEMY|nr:Alpha-mannosidase 2x [Chelonia mydas]